jgi:hypothetical protein
MCAAKPGLNHKVRHMAFVHIINLMTQNRLQALIGHAGTPQDSAFLNRHGGADNNDPVTTGIAPGFQQQWNIQNNKALAAARGGGKKGVFFHAN